VKAVSGRPVPLYNLEDIRAAIVDDRRRKSVIFVCFNLIMGLVSLFMTVVNIITAKWLLMCATLLFGLACLANAVLYILGGPGRKVVVVLFLVEALGLCGFFCVSGTPEGFSALWTCFIPSFIITFLGRKWGSVYAGAAFLMVAFLFWTPVGQGLLHYRYTDSFLLRFPMIYLAFFAMAIFLETIRTETQRRLIEAELRYQHLYKHDALTGIYNRYGFNERLDTIFEAPKDGDVSLLILDLDFFKNINDTYGHDGGDAVLRFTADTLCRIAGEDAAVCRWGGEEFTVLLWNGRDAKALAEDVRREMETSVISAEGRNIRVTVSIGVCTADRRACTIPQLVKAADQQLYAAKEAGRNRVSAVCLPDEAEGPLDVSAAGG